MRLSLGIFARPRPLALTWSTQATPGPPSRALSGPLLSLRYGRSGVIGSERRSPGAIRTPRFLPQILPQKTGSLSLTLHSGARAPMRLSFSSRYDRCRSPAQRVHSGLRPAVSLRSAPGSTPRQHEATAEGKLESSPYYATSRGQRNSIALVPRPPGVRSQAPERPRTGARR